MPKMIDLGSLKFTPKEVTGRSVRPADKVQLEAILEYDCFPKPTGGIKRFNRPDGFAAGAIPRFLQDKEETEVSEILKAGFPQIITKQAAFDLIFDKLGLKSISISYVSDAYKQILKAVQKRRLEQKNCFRTTLYVRVEYKVFEIKVTAIKDIDITIPFPKTKINYPAGDEVATFRVQEPSRYRFETQHQWNPECCPKRPEKTPGSTTTDWLASLDLDDLNIKAGFDLRPRFRLKLRYEFDDEDDDDRPRIIIKPGF